MKITFEFEHNDFESTIVQKLSEGEIEKLEVIGKCPICKSDVVASDSYYACKGYFNKFPRFHRLNNDNDDDDNDLDKSLIG
jgi:hypothetical protein